MRSVGADKLPSLFKSPMYLRTDRHVYELAGDHFCSRALNGLVAHTSTAAGTARIGGAPVLEAVA